MKIDANTNVPLGWMIATLVTVASGSVSLAIYASTINARLERIEEKLGLPKYSFLEVPRHEASFK